MRELMKNKTEKQRVGDKEGQEGEITSSCIL
jgi:hypothetical protein